jgi:hypothetical protein
MARNPVDDLEIQMLIARELELRETNQMLVELVADLVCESDWLHRAFVHILRFVDDARLDAQRQCDALWEALALKQERAS